MRVNVSKCVSVCVCVCLCVSVCVCVCLCVSDCRGEENSQRWKRQWGNHSEPLRRPRGPGGTRRSTCFSSTGWVHPHWLFLDSQLIHCTCSQIFPPFLKIIRIPVFLFQVVHGPFQTCGMMTRYFPSSSEGLNNMLVNLFSGLIKSSFVIWKRVHQ